MLFIVFIGGVIFLTGLIKMLLATYAPKAYEAMMADEERRRQRRNGALKTGIGIASMFFKK